ncbi:MAG: MacB family efflux pump subunit [Elusimicrobia bacterium GWA2_56_46]|nr:MAG: MacB family efflux pump subunit [Elusimicrobia bacterium GWA2_56_46]OGR55881.1 MAG: MacB family efflux pump subunit [Elusimicrobia bacterium GWC2_56_31]HBW22184.1 MacB family efflux pump subunit [Elusimicrobiota bacterium]
MIELKGIKKIYQMGGEPLEVLRGVDLSVKEGEFVAIMGPSGSGKSTLMHILGLLDRPSSGSYKLFGREISELDDVELSYLRARIIGFVFQQFNLLPRITAADNVALPQIYLGEKARPAEAGKYLAQVGLGDRAGHKPNQLSGGQQQRVAIARSLVNAPKIIFADEPTGNLASDQSSEIMAIFRKLNDQGITVIIVTHEPEIAAWADRVIKVKDGLVVEDLVKKAPLKKETDGHLRIPRSFFLSWLEVSENMASSINSIISNKTRSFLTMLGIIIGVGALIAMLAVGTGAQRAIEKQMSSLGTNLLAVIPGNRSQGGMSLGRGAVSRLTLADAKALARSVSNVTRTDSNVQGSAQLVYGPRNYRSRVTGVTAVYPSMRAAEPYYGRFFSEDENTQLRKVALLGQTVVTQLFGAEDPVGKSIKINRKNFTVIGVLPMKGAAGFQDQDDTVIVPLNTAMKILLGKQYVDSIWVEVSDYKLMPAVQDEIKALMRKRHGVPAYKEDDVSLMNMADLQSMLTGTIKTFSTLLGIIAGISLMVGGIGIMNIMLVSVSERTKEIGLRKAIGATRRAVLLQFLIEAVIISVIGGLLGIIAGAGSSILLSRISGWAVYISPFSVALAFGFSATVGVVFGFWPAKKASLLSPIDALRYE